MHRVRPLIRYGKANPLTDWPAYGVVYVTTSVGQFAGWVTS